MISRRDVVKAGLAGSARYWIERPFVRSASAQAPTSLQIFVPAAPGGGWDQTGRTIELALRTDGIVKDFKFERAPGAGGAVGMPEVRRHQEGPG